MGLLEDRFRQDASVAGTLLAFGLSSLVIAGALFLKIDFQNDAESVPAIVYGSVLFTPGPVVFLLRLLRSRKGARRSSRCELCSASPAAEVRYLQVVGIVVLVIFREARLDACRQCSAKACNEMSLKTAAFGWWMPLAALVVPWVLANNLLFFLKARRQLSSSTGVAAALGEHVDYARNLLRTKERATVVEVLSAQSGVPAAAVETWLRTLE